MINIHKNFIGGNIRVASEKDNEIFLENELRDTVGDWFYWAFCNEGAQGRELTFHFQNNRLGYWGPAVSLDGENWHWLGKGEKNSFTYRFADDESKVFFAHHAVYPVARFDRLAKKYGIEIKELCKSKKGRTVPYIEFGEGSRTMILTARHHACESTGDWTLEGVLEELLTSPMPDTRVMCVPFVDIDGVIEGDQGKSRAPHDHNRDYTDEPIYPETAAIMDYIVKNGVNYAFDFHSPWHWGGENDKIFVVRKRGDREDEYDRFGTIFERECGEDSMKYKVETDRKFGEGWNKESPSSTVFMFKRPECELSLSLENAYFGTAEDTVTPEKLLNLGRAFARAVKKYDKER